MHFYVTLTFPVNDVLFFPELFVFRKPRVSGPFEVTRAQKSDAWPLRPLRHSFSGPGPGPKSVSAGTQTVVQSRVCVPLLETTDG